MPEVMGWAQGKEQDRLGFVFAWGPGKQSLEHSCPLALWSPFLGN